MEGGYLAVQQHNSWRNGCDGEGNAVQERAVYGSKTQEWAAVKRSRWGGSCCWQLKQQQLAK